MPENLKSNENAISRNENLMPANEVGMITEPAKDTLIEVYSEAERIGYTRDETEKILNQAGLVNKFTELNRRFEENLKKFRATIGICLFVLSLSAPEALAQTQDKTEEINSEEKATHKILSPAEIRKNLITDEVEHAFISFSDSPKVEYLLSIGIKTSVRMDKNKINEMIKKNGQAKEAIISHTHPLSAHEELGLDMEKYKQADKIKNFLGAPPSSADILSAIVEMRNNEDKDLCIKSRVYGVDGTWDFELSGGLFYEEYEKYLDELKESMENFKNQLPPQGQARYEEILNTKYNDNEIIEAFENEEIFKEKFNFLLEGLSEVVTKHEKVIEKITVIDELQYAAAWAGTMEEDKKVAQEVRNTYIEKLKEFGIMMKFTPNEDNK
jgi:hypothetical protein